MSVAEAVTRDLEDETPELLPLLEGLDDWDLPTPADGWTVRDQVTHLAWFDDATTLALTDPDAFRAQRDEAVTSGAGPDVVAAEHRDVPGSACLAWLVRSRTALLAALRAAPPGHRMPWYGPDMGVASAATARLMETWAHGQDVADALGVVRPPTARLRSVADLGVRTLGFAFALRGLPVPEVPVRVELQAPDGGQWTWGPAEAADRVTGPAPDFCLLVTQRRHRDDLALTAAGPVAEQWLGVAQAYAGVPGPGRGRTVIT